MHRQDGAGAWRDGPLTLLERQVAEGKPRQHIVDACRIDLATQPFGDFAGSADQEEASFQRGHEILRHRIMRHDQ